MTVFQKVMALLKDKNMSDVLVTGGGIIPEEDMKQLHDIGVGRLFAPGTPTADIAEYIRSWVQENREF
jgi:methylmalonyl-CoA mutase C-terminal domain/subunit